MSQLHPPDPDDSLTVDGADLLAEIRERHAADLLDDPRPGDDPVHTEPTQGRWKPAVKSATDTVDSTDAGKTLSRPQLVAIVLACLLGVGAALATWRGSEPSGPPSAIVMETE